MTNNVTGWVVLASNESNAFIATLYLSESTLSSGECLLRVGWPCAEGTCRKSSKSTVNQVRVNRFNSEANRRYEADEVRFAHQFQSR